MESNSSITVGAEFEVTVEKLVYHGEGLARIGERVVFIPGAAAGDQLRVRITGVEKRHLRAEIVAIVSPAPARRTPPCRYFYCCGGCQLQHIDYQTQLAAKAEFIRDSLTRIGHIELPAHIEVEHAAEFGYRSRVQFKIARDHQPLQLGFYQAGTHEVCDIEECLILLPALNQALTQLRNQRHEIAASTIPYTKLELAGSNTNPINAQTPQVAAHPAVAGFNNEPVTQQARGIDYTFDPECFFQVNSLLLETLIDTAIGDRKGKLAVDLYAGVGLFTLQLAQRFQRVIAAEVNPRAVKWAEYNIKANHQQNIEFHALSTERWLSKNARRLKDVDLLLVDPPRLGVERNALANIVTLQPQTIVYVSCDPTTLARDLRVLLDQGYQLQQVTGVDLFPQTYHIESVAVLQRNSNKLSR